MPYYVWDPDYHGDEPAAGYQSNARSPEAAAEEACEHRWSQWDLWERTPPLRFSVQPRKGGDTVIVDVDVRHEPAFTASRARQCRECDELAEPGETRCYPCRVARVQAAIRGEAEVPR